MDRLTSMAVFVKSVDLGSFAAAAAALELSGPMVGKHVRALEARLGARLINRTTRRQSLTELGRAYYERCTAVLAEAEAADALALKHYGRPMGRLRVTMPVLFGRTCVAPLLRRLAGQHPALELDLAFNDRLADLAHEEFDIAIRTGELDDQAGVMARRIASQRMIVCASPAYLQGAGMPATIEALESHNAIVYRRSGRVRPWLFPQTGAAPAQISPRHRFRFDDLGAIADAACDGAGIAWLPSWLVQDRLNSGELIRLLPEQAEYRYEVYALWRASPAMPPRIRVAIDMLAEGVPGVTETFPTRA